MTIVSTILNNIKFIGENKRSRKVKGKCNHKLNMYYDNIFLPIASMSVLCLVEL